MRMICYYLDWFKQTWCALVQQWPHSAHMLSSHYLNPSARDKQMKGSESS